MARISGTSYEMHGSDYPLDFVESLQPALCPTVPLFGRLDVAAPAVGARNRPGHLHAGGQSLLDQLAPNPLGILLVLGRRDDLNESRHH